MPKNSPHANESAITTQKAKYFVKNWALQSLLTYINWWDMFLDYLYPSFIKDYVLKTWGYGSFLIRPKTGDVAVANKVFISNEYRINRSKEKTVAIDIGANIGAFSVAWLRRNPNGVIYSYEPEPQNFAQLNKNLKLNKVDKRAVAMDSVILEDQIERHGLKTIDFLKIDYEGSEYEILYGLKKSTVDKIRKIIVEAHTLKSAPKTHTPDVLYRHLVARGFKVERKVFFEYAKTELFICER